VPSIEQLRYLRRKTRNTTICTNDLTDMAGPVAGTLDEKQTPPNRFSVGGERGAGSS